MDPILIYLSVLIAISVSIVGVIWPLEQISRHAARKYGALTVLHARVLGLPFVNSDPEDRDRRSSGLPLFILMAVVLAFGLGFLTLGTSDIRFAALIPTIVGALYFTGQYARHRWVQSPRPLVAPSAPPQVRISCPNCSQVMALPRGEAGTIVCPGCDHRFHASTKPLLALGWLWAVVLLVGWVVLVRPWPPDGATPFATFVGSMVAGGAAWMICKISPLRRRCSGRREVNLSLLSQLAFAFWTMATVAGALMIVELAILLSGSVGHDTAHSAITERLRLLAFVASEFKRLQIALWIDAGVFAALLVLMILSQQGLIGRVMLAHKHTRKVLKVATMIVAAIGSFSLASAAVGPRIGKSAAGAWNRLNATAGEPAIQFQQGLARQMVMLAIEALPPEPLENSSCVSDVGAGACPTLVVELAEQAARANDLGRMWPKQGKTLGLPTSPAETAGKQAQAWQRALTMSEAVEPIGEADLAHAWDRLPTSATPASFERAAQALRPEATAAASLRKEMLGRAFDLLGMSAPVPDFNLGEITGPFAEKLKGALKGAARGEVDAVARNLAAEILELCLKPANCTTAVRQRLLMASKDPRVVAFSRRVMNLAEALGSGGRDALRRTRQLNDQAAPLLREATLTALTEERASRWGKLRRDWTVEPEALQQLDAADPRVGSIELMYEWRSSALDLAAAHPSWTAQEWDQEFLIFIAQEPTRAAAFDYMVRTTPGTGVVESALGDGFLLLAKEGNASQIVEAERIAGDLRAGRIVVAESGFWRRLILALVR